MANRGFDITDILPSGVTLNIPTFKGRRDQLNLEETDETARTAAVRTCYWSNKELPYTGWKLPFVKNNFDESQPAIACSKLTIETLEQGVKYVQS